MNAYPIRPLALGAALLALAVAPVFGAARSEVSTVEKRRAVVDLATSLAKPQPLPKISADLVSPFAPPNFGQGQSAASTAPIRAVTQPSSARDVLNLVAPHLPPGATMIFRGESLLLLGDKRLKEGDTLTVTVNDTPYELELVAINSNSFTLRYKGEDITRPITK